MRWLVVGSAGMLGSDLVSFLASRGEWVLGVDRDKIDILQPASIAKVLSGAGVDVIVNCAAWTAVDAAETAEADALALNGIAPGYLAAQARALGSMLVQVSTDYVFDGESRRPYTEDSPAAPRSAYGRTKLAGELAVRKAHPHGHLIVRTAWLYGANGACFPKTIARLARERGALNVVDDQVGQPTWTRDVAAIVVALVRANARGTFHATSSGQASWYEFAQAVVESAGMDALVVSPANSMDIVRPAPRPAYSVLAHGALLEAGVLPIAPWRDRWNEAAPEILSGSKD